MDTGCDYVLTREEARDRYDRSEDDFDELWTSIVESRGLDGEVWSCPHDGVDGGNCVFHRDPGEIDGDRQAEALLEALAAVERSPRDGGHRHNQLVGATFGDLDLDGADLSLPDTARVDFFCATFAGAADFTGCRLPAPTFAGAVFEGRTQFDDAIFEGRVFFNHARFDAETTFDGATFDETVSFDEATFAVDTYLVRVTFADVAADGPRSTAPVSFYESTVQGDFDLTDGTFDEPLYLSSMTVEGDLELEECEFFESLTVSDTQASDRLVTQSCQFYRTATDATVDEIAGATPTDADTDYSPVRYNRVETDFFAFDDCRCFREFTCASARADTLYLQESAFLDTVTLASLRLSTLATRDAWFGDLVKLIDCRIPRAEIEETVFDGHVNGTHATLTNASFPDSELGTVNFRQADLTAADLSDTSLRGADLSSATLSRAVLKGADLRGADLAGAALGGVHIDEETRFLHPPVDEIAAEYSLPLWLRDAVPLGSSTESYCGPDPKFESTDEAPAANDDWPDRDAATTLYRRIETVAGNHGRSTLQRRAFVRGQDLRHKQIRQSSSALDARYLFSRLQRGVFVYGESFARVVVVSFTIIFVFGLLYPLGGLTSTVAPDGTTTPLTVARVLDDPLLLWRSVYHSAMMFATGNRYGGIEATTTLGQAVTSVEALLGPTMLALVVFVLGRRAAR